MTKTTSVTVRSSNEDEKSFSVTNLCLSLFLGMILTMFVIVPAFSIVTGTISNTFQSILIDPFVTFGLFIRDLIEPYIFVSKCSYQGYDISQCWQLSYYHPSGFLSHCRNLGICLSQCWQLTERFPFQFQNYCLTNLNYPSTDCWSLMNLI